MIEKDIPPPNRSFAGRHRTPCKYPFFEMKEGESVFYGNKAEGAKAYDAAKKIARRGKWEMNFTSRSENGGLRIWRVA